MHLAELIACRGTDPAVLEGLETFLTSTLGKGVVHAKDTPNFIGNRIGVFSILSVLHHTAAFGLGFDEVDALTGPLLGRPKSATYRSEEHTSELQSLMRISYAVFCLTKKTTPTCTQII